MYTEIDQSRTLGGYADIEPSYGQKAQCGQPTVSFSPKVRALSVVLSAIEGGLSPADIRSACDAIKTHLENDQAGG